MHPSLLDRASRRARTAVTRLAAALDSNAKRWVEAGAERRARQARAESAAPEAEPWRQRERLQELAACYGGATLADPSLMFPTPPAAELALTRVGPGPVGSVVWDLAAPSTYEPFLREARDALLGHRENRTIHARWWRPQGGGRAVIVVVHGWRAGAYWMSERMFEVPTWLDDGFEVVAVQLPFHGRRAPAGAPGQRVSFPSANLMRTNEAFGQAIHDVRALTSALVERTGPVPIGALGASLGAYVTALWATLDASLAFAIPMIPLTSLANVMLARSDTSSWRRRLERAGVDELALDAVFAVHSPLSRPVKVAPAGRFIIAGRGDRITPAHHAEALIAHWQCPAYWFDGGHLAQIGRSGAFREARRQLEAAGILGE